MNLHTTDHYLLAKTLVERLQKAGHVALFAGGVVRDLLLHRSCEDIDIATSAHPDQVMALFDKSISVGAQFGVVLIIEQGQEFEIATFRSDSQYVDGRHPEKVDLTATPREDAERRDFTINGMMYDPCTEKLFDYVGGQEDLARRLIKTIGSPIDRFNEDRLRMIRAIRFKNVLGFEMDPKTWSAICDLSGKIASSVSPERIWQELSKMHQKHVLGSCLKDMADSCMLQHIFPASLLAVGDELLDRIQSIHSYTGESLIAAICLLFSQNEASMLRKFAEQMHLSRKEIRIVELFIAYGDFPLWPDELELVRLYALEESFDYLKAVATLCSNPSEFLEKQMAKRAELKFWVDQLVEKKYFVSASDLIPYGIVPGKGMGAALERIFEGSLRQRMTKKDEILHTLLHV